VSAARRTQIVYRIVSRAPGEKRFKWRRFTGAGMTANLEHVRDGLRWQTERGDHPGWVFRIEGRVVVTETGPWRSVEVHEIPEAEAPPR
jgi:hypothetical protein